MMRILHCFSTKIKSLFKEKNKIYVNFCKDCNNDPNNTTTRMASKLNSIQKSLKSYWSVLKSFLTHKKSQSSYQFYTIFIGN